MTHKKTTAHTTERTKPIPKSTTTKKTTMTRTKPSHPKSETMKTTKASHHVSHAHDTSTTVSNESEIATMKTTTPPAPAHSTTSVHTAAPAVDPSATAVAPATTAAAVPTTTTDVSTTSAAAPAQALPYIKAPPKITLPAVPSGVTTVQPANLRGLLPRKQELELVPDAESDLARFSDYATVFGKTAPSLAATEQTLSSAYAWSTLRLQLAAWLAYAMSQETTAWANVRAIVERLAPAFALAAKTDASISENYPSLGSLFGVRASIAKRGAAARKANAKAKGDGRPEYSGKTGKRRKAADAKAALAAQEAAAAQPAGAAPSPVVTPAAGAPVVPSTAPVTSTPVSHS